MSGGLIEFGNSYIRYTKDFEIYDYQNGDNWTYNFLLMVVLLDKLSVKLDKLY